MPFDPSEDAVQAYDRNFRERLSFAYNGGVNRYDNDTSACTCGQVNQ